MFSSFFLQFFFSKNSLVYDNPRNLYVSFFVVVVVPLPIVFLCNVGPSCRLHCCLGDWCFRRLLASILFGKLDLQMVCHVHIRMGHACTHGSKITSLW